MTHYVIGCMTNLVRSFFGVADGCNNQMPDVTHKIIENTLNNTHTITPIQVNREFFCNTKKDPEITNPYYSALSGKMP